MKTTKPWKNDLATNYGIYWNERWLSYCYSDNPVVTLQTQLCKNVNEESKYKSKSKVKSLSMNLKDSKDNSRDNLSQNSPKKTLKEFGAKFPVSSNF